MKAIEAANAVIFDLFHTLTDLESKWSKVPRTSEMLGVSEQSWNDQILLYSTKRLTGEWRDPFHIIKTMAHAIDPAIPEETIQEVVIKRTHRMNEGLRKIPAEVLKTLDTLKKMGKKLGLVSNLDVMEMSGWNGSPLRNYFEKPVFSCEVGLAKPDPRIFQICLEKIEHEAPGCLYVGDGGGHELAVSRSLGMRSVFFSGVMKEFRSEKIEEFKKQANYHIERMGDLLLLDV